MDLQTAKLVAFALLTEAESGVIGKSPAEMADCFEGLKEIPTIERIQQFFEPNLTYLWDNYWSVWGTKVEEAPPPTERAEIEAVEAPETPIDQANLLTIEEALQTPIMTQPPPKEKPPAKKKKR